MVQKQAAELLEQLSPFFPTQKGVHFTSVVETTSLFAITDNTQNILQGVNMPYVNIRVAGSLSKEQKQKISKGVTEVISKEANKPPEAVLIFIDEVPHENVAKAGNLLEPPK